MDINKWKGEAISQPLGSDHDCVLSFVPGVEPGIYMNLFISGEHTNIFQETGIVGSGGPVNIRFSLSVLQGFKEFIEKAMLAQENGSPLNNQILKQNK